MQNHLSEDHAITLLRKLCDDAGGVKAFAEMVGVDVSAVSHQIHGRRPIQGKVAEHMGLTVHRETKISYKQVQK